MKDLYPPDCPICQKGPVLHWINGEFVVECKNPDCTLIAWAILESPLALNTTKTIEEAAEQWHEVVKAYKQKEYRHVAV